jgi:5'-nucleotidase
MILLVNDDGIDAPGLRALYHALRATTGLPVLAVAPTQERSGQSHAITIDRALHTAVRHEPGFFGFSLDGTPADCTKMALDRLCATPPALVVSGINRGPNVGRSLFYSGTVAAAMEAAVLGHRALAVSRQLGHADDEDGARLAAGVAHRMLSREDLRGVVVNLNVPSSPAAAWQPLVTAPHGLAGFQESYRPVHEGGRPAWRLEGRWQALHEHGTDATFLTQGHPVLTLLRPDLNGDQRLLQDLVP